MAEQGKEQQGKQEMAPSERGQVQRVTPARAMTPFDEMDRMFDRMFESFFPRGWMRPFGYERPAWLEVTEARIPRVDVVDRDEDILLRAEIPGISKENLEITTTENTVTIKGSEQREEKEEKGDYYRAEIARGGFTRTIALPSGVDASKARAKFEQGMLELTLPKVEKAKRHTIKVE